MNKTRLIFLVLFVSSLVVTVVSISPGQATPAQEEYPAPLAPELINVTSSNAIINTDDYDVDLDENSNVTLWYAVNHSYAIETTDSFVYLQIGAYGKLKAANSAVYYLNYIEDNGTHHLFVIEYNITDTEVTEFFAMFEYVSMPCLAHMFKTETARHSIIKNDALVLSSFAMKTDGSIIDDGTSLEEDSASYTINLVLRVSNFQTGQSFVFHTTKNTGTPINMTPTENTTLKTFFSAPAEVSYYVSEITVDSNTTIEFKAIEVSSDTLELRTSGYHMVKVNFMPDEIPTTITTPTTSSESESTTSTPEETANSPGFEFFIVLGSFSIFALINHRRK